MLVDRYSIPWVDQTLRDPFVNGVDTTRQNWQHFEMLANCAEFVPGPQGAACSSRLDEIVTELATDNLSAGPMCAGDIPSPTQCFTPQQFMINSMMHGFFMRVWLNWIRPSPGICSRVSPRGPGSTTTSVCRSSRTV